MSINSQHYKSITWQLKNQNKHQNLNYNEHKKIQEKQINKEIIIQQEYNTELQKRNPCMSLFSILLYLL